MRGLAVFALIAGCGASEPFVCAEHDDCAGASEGLCEPTGFCSFPDEDCGSGRRYGQHAGDGLQLSCVPEDNASGSTGTGSGEGDSDPTLTSSDPTTASATLTATSNTSADTGETTSPIDVDTSTSMDPDPSTDGTSTTGEPLDPDLVAWYRFEQDEFDDGVIDEVGLHDGTCSPGACPLAAEGILGSAAQFDGIDDIVRVALSDLLAVDAAITVTLWMRVDFVDVEFRTLAAKAYLDMYDDTWELGLSGASPQFTIMTSTGFVAVDRGATELDTWIHAAGVWDGQVVRLYLDGALIGEVVATDILQDEHEITLGAGNDFGVYDNFFDGALDEVRIYRRALAEDEVAALASAP